MRFFRRNETFTAVLGALIAFALLFGGLYAIAQTPMPARNTPAILYKSDGTEVGYISATAHDATASTVDPILTGCYSSAAAPSDVSADTDAVRAWCLRNGARAIQPTFAGVLAVAGNGASGTGVQRVTIANDSTGVVAATQSGTWTVQPGNTANTTAWLTSSVPTTSGGLSISRTVSGASTNATNIKNAAGQVYGIVASNVNAAARYVHLYNNSGSPTCNASIIATFVVPGNTAGAGTNIPLFPGVAFSTGIAICFTSGIDGTGNAASNDGVITVLYK